MDEYFGQLCELAAADRRPQEVTIEQSEQSEIRMPECLWVEPWVSGAASLDCGLAESQRSVIDLPATITTELVHTEQEY